jgi:hypothetical protein
MWLVFTEIPPSPILNPPPSMIGMGLATRGSVILYRLASDNDRDKDRDSVPSRDSQHLLPPKLPQNLRDSTVLNSKSSFVSMELDSNFAGLAHRDSAFPTARDGLVPHEYNPALDELDPGRRGEFVAQKGKVRQNTFAWRGLMNVTVLLLLISGMLALFVFYPVFQFYRDKQRNGLIDGNIRINVNR